MQSLKNFTAEVEKAGSKVLPPINGFHQVTPPVNMLLENKDLPKTVVGYIDDVEYPVISYLPEKTGVWWSGFAYAKDDTTKYIEPIQLAGAVVDFGDGDLITVKGVSIADGAISVGDEYAGVEALSKMAHGWRYPHETEWRSFVEGE